MVIRNEKKKNGFTLMEMVIVIAVIAVLASVLIPSFGGIVANAKLAQAKQESINCYTSFYSATIERIENGDEKYLYQNTVIRVKRGGYMYYFVIRDITLDLQYFDKAPVEYDAKGVETSQLEVGNTLNFEVFPNEVYDLYPYTKLNSFDELKQVPPGAYGGSNCTIFITQDLQSTADIDVKE